VGAYVILRGLRSCRGYFPPPPPGSTPPPPARNESAAYELRLPGPRLARLSRNPESRCVGAVWAVNKPGRDARRLDHGNRPRQKQRMRRRGTADRGVSAVRGGPWPDVPKPERTTRNPPRTGGPVPSRVRHAPRPGRRGHKVHNCQLPAPVPRSLPRRGSARRSLRRSPRARAHGQPEPLSLGVRCACDLKHFLVLFLGHLNSQTSSKYCLRDGEAHHAARHYPARHRPDLARIHRRCRVARSNGRSGADVPLC
jgi:hypothetical protein